MWFSGKPLGNLYQYAAWPWLWCGGFCRRKRRAKYPQHCIKQQGRSGTVAASRQDWVPWWRWKYNPHRWVYQRVSIQKGYWGRKLIRHTLTLLCVSRRRRKNHRSNLHHKTGYPVKCLRNHWFALSCKRQDRKRTPAWWKIFRYWNWWGLRHLGRFDRSDLYRRWRRQRGI